MREKGCGMSEALESDWQDIKEYSLSKKASRKQNVASKTKIVFAIYKLSITN